MVARARPEPLAPEPLLRVENRERALVLADIHLGYEAGLRRRGVAVPSQTDILLEQVLAAVDRERPDRLVVLGDVKHTVPGASLQERLELPRFFGALRDRVAVEIVPGNHDGRLLHLLGSAVGRVPVRPMSGAVIDGVAYMHGHTWPPPALLRCPVLVLGHDHLVVELRDEVGGRQRERAWVRTRLDRDRLPARLRKHARREVEVIVAPAFNGLLGGVPVNGGGGFMGPLLRCGAVDMAGGEVHLLDGTYLGRVRDLPVYPKSVGRSPG